jgi:hypothetical protein
MISNEKTLQLEWELEWEMKKRKNEWKVRSLINSHP